MKRFATALWQGTGKEGKGHLTNQSGVLNKMQYSYVSRFEEGIGTNPEELIAAAHAGCFTMKLAFCIDEAGFKATELITRCVVTLEAGTITKSHLSLQAQVPGVSQEVFAGLVKDAEKNCPVSKALSIDIEVEFTLNQ